jgi:Mg/Co/Ni transporter MgtE
MSVDSIVEATEGLDMDDLADIVPDLPESALHNLLLQSSKEVFLTSDIGLNYFI